MSRAVRSTPCRWRTAVRVVEAIALLSIEVFIVPTAQVGAVDEAAPLTARGWGRLSEDGGYPCAARSTALEFVPPTSCASLAERPELFFCARPKQGENTCSGDSGGPAYQRTGESFVVVGLVDGGLGCEQPRTASIAN